MLVGSTAAVGCSTKSQVTILTVGTPWRLTTEAATLADGNALTVLLTAMTSANNECMEKIML